MSEDQLKAALDIIIEYLTRLHAPTEEQAEFGNAMLDHIRWIRDGTVTLPELEAMISPPRVPRS